MLLFLIFLLQNSASALPTGNSVFAISSVERSPGRSDTIRAAICAVNCKKFRAVSVDNCSCVCSADRPAFISSTATCVDRIEECTETITWKGISSPIPVIQLRPHTIILPDYDLDFKNSHIQISESGEVECKIRHILYENIHTKWKHLPVSDGLFQLTSSNKKPILYFGGTEDDAVFLVGAVVAVKLECVGSTRRCITLRIAGSSDRLSLLDHRDTSSEIEEPEWKIQTVFLLIVVITIIVVLTITCIVWNLCWRMKKRKLISDFQMQFVQQYRNAQNRIFDMQNFENIDEQEIVATQGLNRKRLIFSAEYFDHNQMLDPSPLALQFIHDLRRVVDMARDKIRQRRFIPTLSCIVEEAHEKCYSHPVPESSEEHGSYDSSANSSPQTEPKSVDSGRESREEASEEEEEDEKTATSSKVSDIVRSFENKSTPPMSTNLPTRPSLVPIMLNSSMRLKNRKLTPVAKSSPPPPSADDAQPAPVKPPFQTKLKPPMSLSARKSGRERGYAVFPSDGTFNKSLPRRTKRFSNPPKPTT